MAWAAKLDSWGNVLQEYNPQGMHQAIRLPGQHHDRETGLYYNRHRYYDPVVGGYVNQDPIGLEGGSNQYAYSLNSPLEISDPTGLIPPLLIIGVMALVGGVVGAGTNVAKQKIINKKCKIDRGETMNSGAWSALGGAAMPLIGTTALGAAAIGEQQA